MEMEMEMEMAGVNNLGVRLLCSAEVYSAVLCCCWVALAGERSEDYLRDACAATRIRFK